MKKFTYNPNLTKEFIGNILCKIHIHRWTGFKEKEKLKDDGGCEHTVLERTCTRCEQTTSVTISEDLYHDQYGIYDYNENVGIHNHYRY